MKLNKHIKAFSVPLDYGYRFIHNNIRARDLTVHYAPVYAAAGNDFATAGNLTFFGAPANLNRPYSGHIAYIEANYGANGWAGAAIGYNVLEQPCADITTGTLTGNCTMTQGADFAVVLFNSFYNPNPSNAVMAHLLRHETSHVLGLGHEVCTPSTSVMSPNRFCTPMHTTLQPDDVNLINAWYP